MGITRQRNFGLRNKAYAKNFIDINNLIVMF